ncbi:MAG: hydrogenase maturation protease [Verrucomicrobiales bacterium]|nr:hydrogenase maturation protease [Verrucomicrobiales bacterium]
MFDAPTNRISPASIAPVVSSQFDLLVVGYGSLLHGDDGVGPWIADLVERLEWPGVRCRALTQLTPDLASDLAQAKAVVFVDASIRVSAGHVQVGSLDPGAPETVDSHRCTPKTLLFLARELFGHAPRGWMISVGASVFELGQPISPAVAHTQDTVLREVKVLLDWASDED